MITTLILEDEPNAQELLKYFIVNFCPEADLVGVASDSNQAYELILQHKPELLLLDIEVGHEGSPETSFELLARLPTYRYEVIFITAFNQYALQAIKFHALDYLLKPIHIDELKSAVQKAHQRITEGKNTQQIVQFIQKVQAEQERGRDRIWLQAAGSLQAISIKDIIRLEAEDGLTHIYTTDLRRRTTAQPMRELMEQLENQPFFSPHRAHCVNLKHVVKVIQNDGGELIMSDDSRVPISRRRKQELMALLQSL